MISDPCAPGAFVDCKADPSVITYVTPDASEARAHLYSAGLFALWGIRAPRRPCPIESFQISAGTDQCGALASCAAWVRFLCTLPMSYIIVDCSSRSGVSCAGDGSGGVCSDPIGMIGVVSGRYRVMYTGYSD